MESFKTQYIYKEILKKTKIRTWQSWKAKSRKRAQKQMGYIANHHQNCRSLQALDTSRAIRHTTRLDAHHHHHHILTLPFPALLLTQKQRSQVWISDQLSVGRVILFWHLACGKKDLFPFCCLILEINNTSFLSLISQATERDKVCKQIEIKYR